MTVLALSVALDDRTQTSSDIEGVRPIAPSPMTRSSRWDM